MVVFDIRDLEVYYETTADTVQAVDGVSFCIEQSTIVGLLGESGCGKTTLAESIIRALPENAVIPSGEIRLDGEDLLEMPDDRFREVRWERIAYIPQSAMASLDPVFTIKEQMIETVLDHRSTSKRECVARAEEVMEVVGIDPARLDDYPHQLSGGMRQRVILAMSLLLNPDLIVADEPTTGVDVLVRDKILHDLEQYRDEFDMAILYISHDIADLVETCDELMVMYGGKVVEMGPAREVFHRPTHPYTIGLKNALPEVGKDPEELVTMDIDPPDLRSPPDGCRFVKKCPYVEAECWEAHPPYATIGDVESACYRADEAETLRATAREVAWTRE